MHSQFTVSQHALASLTWVLRLFVQAGLDCQIYMIEPSYRCAVKRSISEGHKQLCNHQTVSDGMLALRGSTQLVCEQLCSGHTMSLSRRLAERDRS